MYVAPNSTIKLLHNVPLDDRYTDTVLFSDKNTQAVTFGNYTKATFSAQSYQRIHKNRLRIEAPFNSVCDCNYMMFQNTSFGTKWWYAFINAVEYVNNATTEIYYTLDPVQNWITDWTLLPCFVERNHVTNDAIGANIVPEPVSGGNRYTGYGVSTMPKGETVLDTDAIKCIYVFAGYNQDDIVPTGATPIEYYQGLPRGISCYKFKSSEMNVLNAWLKNLTTKNMEETIIGMFAFYGYYDGLDNPSTQDAPCQREWKLNSDEFQIPFIQNILGYNPHNNKLFTFPYNVIRIDNGNGDSAFYRYEFFGTDGQGNIDPTFKVDGAITCPPEMFCRPSNYMGDAGESYSDAIGLRDFPQVPYTINGFLAWMGSNFVPTTLSLASTLIGGAVGGAKGAILAGEGVNKAYNKFSSASSAYRNNPTPQNAVDMMNARSRFVETAEHAENLEEIRNMEMAESVSSKILNDAEVPIQATQSHAGSSSILYALGFMEFEAFQECISPQMAKIIDEYFDRFGYAINETQTPNISARQYYTYIKTKGCKISGDIPNDDRHVIESIFDNGITFWKSLTNVGNYTSAIMVGNVIV